MIKKILYWIPPILWMTLIFHLSSKSRFTATGEPLQDFLIFKSLHMCEYGLLALLLFNALYNTVRHNLSIAIRYSGLISLAYAASDEYHQLFTPTRSGTPRDIIIDGFGILIMLCILQAFYKKRPLNKRI